jgi:hypothetical protein
MLMIRSVAAGSNFALRTSSVPSHALAAAGCVMRSSTYEALRSRP